MAQDAIGAIPRQRYYETQLLYAPDFEREQQYGTALRQLQSRLLFTPGVLVGLDLTSGAQGQVQVAPGAAVDDSGSVVLLVDRATLDGAEITASSDGFTLDLTPGQYHGKTWLLTLQFAEQEDPSGAFFTQVPALALSEDSSAAAGQIPLARLAVSAPAAPPTPGGTAPSPTVTIDTSVRAAVVLSPSRMPLLDAAAVATGTLDPARLPALPASAITSGSFDAARIPPLDASSIGTGTLALDRIPDLPASKVIGGGPTVWAQALAFWPRGATVASRAAGRGPGFFVALLRTDTDQGRVYYALGIGFDAPLLSFQAPQLAAAGVRTGIYPDRTGYSLAREGGQAGENATSVRFMGVEAELGFDLLTPESGLPPAQQGKVAGLVVVGTRAANPSADPPEGPVAIVQGLRDAVSPFSFAAVASPQATVPPAQAALAQELHAAGWIAPEAAPAIAAVQLIAPATLLTLLTRTFPESTATVAQAAWALAAAGADPSAASDALRQLFTGRASLSDAAAALAGAFPPPAVQEVVVGLQIAGATAQDAAAALSSAGEGLGARPITMAVLLQVAFPSTADTPLHVAQALRAADFTAGAEVNAALQQLFPTTAADEILAAAREAFSSG